MDDIRKLNDPAVTGAELLAAIRAVKATLAPCEHLAMGPDGKFIVITTTDLTPKGEG